MTDFFANGRTTINFTPTKVGGQIRRRNEGRSPDFEEAIAPLGNVAKSNVVSGVEACVDPDLRRDEVERRCAM
jgi:hypothetical protein